ncbi:MAG: TOBE domain-containing protein, partial [Alphaproteobacteria bacterium]|nr:TOBE domain-containing protein [Alphaproteobacteria bacterium]
TPPEIYRRPATRFVAEFAGRANHFPGTVCAIAGNVARIDTETGLSLQVLADGLALGNAVIAMLRPERVRLDGGVRANQFTATVTSATYLGGVVSYRLQAGQQSRLAEAASMTDDILAPGATVQVSWDQSDCVVLRQN